MKIISFIENAELIEKILQHVGLWEVKTRPPLKAHAPPADPPIDYTDAHIQYGNDDYSDPEYPFEAYIA
jgi:hypothetical protein